MKVLNITMHAVNNYGSVLQTLATEKIFQNLGCEVETLDYIQDSLQLNSVRKIVKYGGPGLKIKVKQIALLLLSKRDVERDRVFDYFRRKYIHLSPHRYLSCDELMKNPPLADIYCTGSDQTWNTTLHGVSKAYFLAFTTGKKIAFSASFGINRLPEKDIEKVKEYLSSYYAISVRESSGLKILQEQLEMSNAEHVLDPTLAVDASFWDSLASERLFSEDYIFVYQLNSSDKFTEYVNNFARKKGLKVISVRARKNTGIEGGIFVKNPKPEDVLSLFKYSTYVITDSFHATVFSLIFHRNFINIYPPHFSTRIQSLLELTELLNRRVVDLNDYNYCDTPIDYNKVDIILNKEREKTMTFIKGAVLN